MPSSIPRMNGRKRCKICLQNLRKSFWMEDLGDRIKCPNCGREVPITGGKPKSGSLRSADPIRFRTGSVRRYGQDKPDTWETPAPIRRPGRKTVRQSVGRFPLEPDFDIFHSQKNYQIIINLPYHKDLEDVRCEVINSTLVVKSLKDGFDFLQKFSLPEGILPASLKTSLKNAVLDIHFKKTKNKTR